MANARELPPPIDPKKEPVTVHVLSGKLDAFFNNVKELIESTARRTENTLRMEIQQTEKRLDVKIDGVRTELKETEKHLSDKIDNNTKEIKQLSEKLDKVDGRLNNHETRITNPEAARL